MRAVERQQRRIVLPTARPSHPSITTHMESYSACITRSILILLVLGSGGASDELLAQWITHHNPIFQGQWDKPSAGQPFRDPRFGTSLLRLTDARSEGMPGIVPQYSKRQA